MIKNPAIPSFLCIILIALLQLSPLNAQPSLNFSGMNVNWPTVSLFGDVNCNSVHQTNLKKENFRVTENGFDVTDFTVASPDTTRPCCMSVALVFDRSGSMGWNNPSWMDAAKLGGKAFVDLMDSTCDEATVVSFNTRVTIDLDMTSEKRLLKEAIDSLIPNSGSTLWEGGLMGVQQVVTNGSQNCRAMILLTDGNDQDYGTSGGEMVALSIPNNIHLFVVGLSDAVNDSDMTHVANDTRGNYYRVRNPMELPEVCKEIYRTIRNGFYETEISYNTKCKDGSRRNVNLTVQNLPGCSGTDTKTRSFRVPKDSTTFQSIEIKLDPKLANQNSFIELPLVLQTPINDLFQPANFRLMYDATCLQFDNCYLDKTLLEGVGISMTPLIGTVEIKTLQAKMINGAGVLAKLVFRTLSRGDSSSRSCPVTLKDWKFTAGCFNAVTTSGEIVLGVEDVNAKQKSFHLSQNYPNPFSDRTSITLTRPSVTLSQWERVGVRVTFKVFDLLGREVLNLSDEARSNSQITIRSSQLPNPGMYFYRLEVDGNVSTKKFVFQK